MQKERTFSQKTALFLKGLAMGAANKVPGVSGGTVSFVLGFYEELIYSFRKINFIALKLLINFRFKSFYSYVNGPFLLLVMGGSIFSYFSISLVLDYFLQNYELYVWSWFFGMIIGSIYYISKGFGEWNSVNVISLLIGVSVGLGISFLKPAGVNDNLWFVFICGIIGVSGMTLPGLSGSFILILMGNYVLLLVDSVNALYDTFSEIISGDFSFIKNNEENFTNKLRPVYTAITKTRNKLDKEKSLIGFIGAPWTLIIYMFGLKKEKNKLDLIKLKKKDKEIKHTIDILINYFLLIVFYFLNIKNKQRPHNLLKIIEKLLEF